MKRKWTFVSGFLVVLLLAVGVSVSQAQGPEPPEPEGPVGVLAGTSLSASPVMSYQGRLLENGNPVTATKAMTFKLYDAQSLGTLLWTEGPKDVAVINGLFNVTLGDTAALNVNNFGKELWLEITVAGTALPRQKLMGAPYAFSLVPGADIIGDIGEGSSLLNVNNAGAGIGVYGASGTGHGVYARGAGSGLNSAALYAVNTDPGGIALSADTNSTDATLVVGNNGSGPLIKGFGGNGGEDEFRVNNNGSIWSEADTEIAVSPLKMVAGYNSNVTLMAQDNGYMEVRQNIAGFQVVYVPVDLPSVLFGTATKLKSVRVCYSVDQAASYITSTSVDYIGDSGGYTSLITDSIDRINTVWECYTLTDATPNAIQGSLSVRFALHFAGLGSSHDIQIGKITLTLTEQ